MVYSIKELLLGLKRPPGPNVFSIAQDKLPRLGSALLRVVGDGGAPRSRDADTKWKQREPRAGATAPGMVGVFSRNVLRLNHRPPAYELRKRVRSPGSSAGSFLPAAT